MADIERTKQFYVGILHFKIEYERSEDIVQKEFLVQDPDGYLLRFTD